MRKLLTCFLILAASPLFAQRPTGMAISGATGGGVVATLRTSSTGEVYISTAAGGTAPPITGTVVSGSTTGGVNTTLLTESDGTLHVTCTGCGSGDLAGTLTATRVPFAAGVSTLTDSANMTFVTDTLSVTKLSAPTFVTSPLYKVTGASSGTVSITGAANAGTWGLVLPVDAGTSGYVLSTDGMGVTSWVAQSGGGGSPAGMDTQIQFNNMGSFGADAGLTFSPTVGLVLSTGDTSSSVAFNVNYTEDNAAIGGFFGGLIHTESRNGMATTQDYNIGLQLEISQVAAGTLTDLIGLKIVPGTTGGGGSVTNSRGILIGDVNQGGTVNNAIETGAGNIVFADSALKAPMGQTCTVKIDENGKLIQGTCS